MELTGLHGVRAFCFKRFKLLQGLESLQGCLDTG